MINIISKALASRHTTGPYKVAVNLMKGLDRIGYPYVVNRALNATRRLWIHDDPAAFMQLPAHSDVYALVGPNLAPLPRMFPRLPTYERMVWLVPSPWVKEWWESGGVPLAPVAVWPVGVDTRDYNLSTEARTYVIVYVKQRSEKEVQAVTESLAARGVAYRIVRYGRYSERQYKALLRGARYAVWVGRHETQGLALEETLSAGVPVVVWDVQSVGHWQAKARYREVLTERELAWDKTTAVPYFDERCGYVARTEQEVMYAIGQMEDEGGKGDASFTPRAYIESHLSLVWQAQAFVDLYERSFRLPVTEGYNETLRSERLWRNATLPYRITSAILNSLKAGIKTIIGERY